MAETTVDPTNPLPPGGIETRAADLDVGGEGPLFGSGSAVSFGEGVYITNGHNFFTQPVDSANNAIPDSALSFSGSTYSIQLRSGLATAEAPVSITPGDVTNIGGYQGAVSSRVSIGGSEDIAAFAMPGVDGPNSGALVYQNANDITGDARTAGFPGGGTRVLAPSLDPLTGAPYDRETMMVSEGHISPNSEGTLRNQYATQPITADTDTTEWAPRLTAPFNMNTIEGIGIIRGQSGSGVDIATTFDSPDNALPPLEFENSLIGVATYGSIGPDINGNPIVSHQASLQGGGITPLSPSAYTNLGPVSASAAQANHVLEEAAAGETTATPLTDQEVADRFAPQTLVADRQGVDGTSTTFNGNIFNETFLANANVNLTSDLGPGTDTADYFLVERGITAEVGPINTMVTKTYVNDPNMIFADGTATATDTYTNLETLRGTAADDTFNIQGLGSGLNFIDGRDVPADRQGLFHSEADTITVDASVPQLTWTFARDAEGNADRTQGTFSDGVDTVGFSGIETVGVREGDITRTEGDIHGVPLDPDLAPAPTPGMTLDAAVTRLAAAQGELAGTNTPVAEAVAHPDAVEMYANLQTAGVERVPAELTPDMDTETVAVELLSAGARASRDAKIPLPEEARTAEAAQAAEASTPAPTAEAAPDYSYDDCSAF